METTCQTLTAITKALMDGYGEPDVLKAVAELLRQRADGVTADTWIEAAGTIDAIAEEL